RDPRLVLAAPVDGGAGAGVCDREPCPRGEGGRGGLRVPYDDGVEPGRERGDGGARRACAGASYPRGDARGRVAGELVDRDGPGNRGAEGRSYRVRAGGGRRGVPDVRIVGDDGRREGNRCLDPRHGGAKRHRDRRRGAYAELVLVAPIDGGAGS